MAQGHIFRGRSSAVANSLFSLLAAALGAIAPAVRIGQAVRPAVRESARLKASVALAWSAA